jgi:hypothetical protein
MHIFLKTVTRRLLVVLNLLTLLAVGPGELLPLAAQTEAAPAKLTPAALDDVVSRVALYPDPLLAQVMAAATFAEQIPDATKWAAEHKTLKGDALAAAMDSAALGFDPSVQALIAFPSVLDLMNKDLDWTQKLGDATLVQRGEVMDAVQRMRKKASDAGNLKTTPQVTIVQSAPQVIEIQPASPTVIYVPVYSPQVVYVAAPPPPPGPSAGTVVAAAVIGFAVGVALSNSYCNSYWGYHGGFGWSSHTVIIHSGSWGRTWVNHTTYIHTWGGSNRGFYSRPNAYINNNRYVRRNTNVNINNNVNVNRNTNINRNTNVNANRNINTNQNANLNRNATVNQNVNRNPSANSARGYAKQSPARSGTFSGVQNGRSEQRASARGSASRSRR